MPRPIFKSNRSDFSGKNEAFVELALARLAMIVEIALKTSSGMPVEFGNMKGQTRSFKNAQGQYRTEVDAEYASAQEAGFINGHPIKNYSTPGTSSGFFARSIDTMLGQSDEIILEAKKAVNL